MITLIATPDQQLRQHARGETKAYTCAIGRAGMIAADDKREGDGASPIGLWPMRRVFYRADRVTLPKLSLPCTPITRQQGWCDAPDDPAYNQLVALPFGPSHEVLWRQDHAYDVVVALGHNDSPPVPSLGSAIFMHVAKPGYTPTEGCIALAIEDLLAILQECTADTTLDIQG